MAAAVKADDIVGAGPVQWPDQLSTSPPAT